MTTHVCRCGPSGRWWQPTTRFMTMHAVTCRLTVLSPGSAPAPYARLRVWVPLPSYLQTNIIAEMLSIGGDGLAQRVFGSCSLLIHISYVPKQRQTWRDNAVKCILFSNAADISISDKAMNIEYVPQHHCSSAST